MLHISIKKNGSNLAAVCGDLHLFDFDYRKELGAWCFWVRGRSQYDPIQRSGRAFPWVYFKDLCRATAFLNFELPLYTAEATDIVSGKSYIK